MRRNADIAARHRLGTIAVVYVLEAIAAALIAAPWFEALAALVKNHPDGDRAILTAPGFPYGSDLIVRLAPFGGALTRVTIGSVVVWFFFSIPIGALLLGALSDEGRLDVRRGAIYAADRTSPLSIIVGFELLAGLVIGGLATIGVVHATDAFSADPPKAFIAGTIGAAFVLLLLAIVHVAADLARAIAVRHALSGLASIGRAVASPSSIAALFALSVPRWVASVGLLGVAAFITARTDAVIAIAVTHQVVAFARVGVRASVLSRSLRMSDVAARPASRSVDEA